MDHEELRKKILGFIKGNLLTVISTVDLENNKPESAVVAFAETEKMELIFGTSNKTRKYRNLQKNQNVSFVIGWDADTGTVQYEGIAKELPQNEALPFAKMLAVKNPRAEKFITREDQRYFLVKPTWIRWLDMTKVPDETFEMSF